MSDLKRVISVLVTEFPVQYKLNFVASKLVINNYLDNNLFISNIIFLTVDDF